MNTGRLEAFTDGVVAIIITIMVLELKAPHGASLADLGPLAPVFVSYVVSFIYVGIYWNNHHHLLHTVEFSNGRIMWANLHFLFWLSLVPFVTNWVGEEWRAAVPAAAYGVVLLMSGFSYTLMEWQIICTQGENSLLRSAVGRERRGVLSMVAYLLAVGLAFVHPWIADALYALVALWWFVPDRRIEKVIAKQA